MFRILKFDDDFVYLSHPDGRLKKIDRTLFDFDIKLGDRIDVSSWLGACWELFWLRFFFLQSQLLSSYGDSWFVLLSGCILKTTLRS